MAKGKSRLAPTVYGVGYIGLGDEVTYITRTKPSWQYTKWANMLKRCYSVCSLRDRPTYERCTVDNSWLNFQEFSKWVRLQRGFGMSGWHLDKDILVKGNKEYGPDVCCLVPLEINLLLVKHDSRRGDLPVGVVSQDGRYRAQGSFREGTSYIGMYGTPEAAFAAYKAAKERYIRIVAEKYKDQIDERAYKALLTYEVRIND